jgi:cleavage stimulation factor subunit 3
VVQMLMGTWIGPVFKTDDLMALFKNAIIPSSSAAQRAPSPPPPSRRGERLIPSV